LKRTMAEQTPAIFEEYVEPYGTWSEYRIYPSGGDLAVFTIDITDRKASEEALATLNDVVERERLRLTGIIASVPGLIWENKIGAEGDALALSFISAYVQPLLGYTVDQALAEPLFWKKVIYADDWQTFTDAVTFVHRGENAGVLNLQAVHKDGNLIDLETRMTIMLDDDVPAGVRGVMMDVTERQRSAKMQERYARMLHQSNEELQQFASVVSHDLQEPLRMVTGYVQLLEKRYSNSLDNDARDFINFAVEGVARMKELITDLLTIARIERSEKISEETDLQDILNNVLSNLSLRIEDTGTVITQDALPRIKADSGQMLQLFQNLVGNAIKFQPGDRQPSVHIGVQHQEGEWVFSVQDNGIGIAREHLDRIFDMFRRLHHRDVYPGTGIGLAICKKVVERHEGRLWVESTPGKGTTFYFTIPG
jgi:signal transduction histidine kinase